MLSIVIPTYREAANIGRIVAELRAAASGCEIIVVDDASDDGTAEVAEAAGATVIVRHERGLATAVMRGLDAATGDYVVIMDGDGQHPVEAIPRMLHRAQARHLDLVVGSRHTDGGSPGEFSTKRRIMSWCAAQLGALALPPIRRHRITDPMSGFFLVRKDAVELAKLRPTGYKILLEILGRCDIQRVGEVGYTFGRRLGGTSKLGAAVMGQYLQHLLILALHSPDNRRVAWFAAVGITGIIVNLAALFIFTEGVGLHYAISAVIAIELSIINNFLCNDVVTFADRRRGTMLGRLVRFNTVALVTLVVNLGVLAALVEWVGMHYLPAEVIAILVAFALNFRGNDRWTYERVLRRQG